MINTIKQDVEERMSKTISVLRSDFQTIRTGKASPSLLGRIQVDYYGAPTPINQLANISTPEARMLVIQPWDKSAISAIEKAIGFRYHANQRRDCHSFGVAAVDPGK